MRRPGVATSTSTQPPPPCLSAAPSAPRQLLSVSWPGSRHGTPRRTCGAPGCDPHPISSCASAGSATCAAASPRARPTAGHSCANTECTCARAAAADAGLGACVRQSVPLLGRARALLGGFPGVTLTAPRGAARSPQRDPRYPRRDPRRPPRNPRHPRSDPHRLRRAQARPTVDQGSGSPAQQGRASWCGAKAVAVQPPPFSLDTPPPPPSGPEQPAGRGWHTVKACSCI